LVPQHMRFSFIAVLFPLCLAGQIGTTTVVTLKHNRYGLQDWSNSYSVVGTVVIVDCVSFQCSSTAGRRLGHNSGPFSGAVIPFPDPLAASITDGADYCLMVR